MNKQNIMHLVDFLNNNRSKYEKHPSFKWVYDLIDWDPNYKDIFYLVDNSVHIYHSKSLKRSIKNNEPEDCALTVKPCSYLNIISRIEDGIDYLSEAIHEYYPVENSIELIEHDMLREPTTILFYTNPCYKKHFFPSEPVSKKESEMLARFFIFWAKSVFYHGYNSFDGFIQYNLFNTESN